MSEYRGLSSKSYRIQNPPFAGGGEGDIYDVVGAPDYVAKVYKLDKRTTERERKLSVMVSNKPSVMEQYAWPLDVLYENGQFIGYIMPKINGKEKLRNIYVYDKRKGKPWSLFIAIAKNLSAAVHNVHEIHQVVGDLNPENILVNPNDGMVTLVDTDSYHISDSSRTYRCGVGMPEFVAPELQGIHFPSALLPTFTPESDRFALAVLIFALLMNGAHPFSCKVISGSSSKFQPIDNMQNGKCAFFSDSRSSNMDIPRYAPDLGSLPENIHKLFRRAFVAGHSTPSLRPSAEEWYNALEQLEDNLKTCLKDTQHIYYYGAKECPWCKVDGKMRSISQSAFNSSSQSGSGFGVGTVSQQAMPSGPAQQFTPSSYKYTPSSSAPVNQPAKKKRGGWIAAIVAVIVIILIVKSCSNSFSTNGNNGGTTNETNVFLDDNIIRDSSISTNSEQITDNPMYSQTPVTTSPGQEIVDPTETQAPVYENESESWGYVTLASSGERSVEALVLRELSEDGKWSEYFDGTKSDVWLTNYPTKSCRVRQTTTITTGREFDLFITNNANGYRSRTGDINQDLTTYDMAIEEYSQNRFDHIYSELDWLDGNPVFDETIEMINDNSWYVYSGYNSGKGIQDFFWILFFIDESQSIAVEVSFEYVLFSGATLADAAFFNEWYLNLSESLLIR